ncbi:TetR/AcrR family transcriptional regulator [Gordonia sp. ABSL1-1]|uniref:TetR/AcrR family transcriptional regulator n=1 Tax=Gordonia sp. ABSL1-1 TaxID=3053923 RepID=UPI002572F3B4|nr:TetR/AcrR family transcriptional regulator [Gordonia sp. ABSL1-1]MDL9937584.1 TetR/AcrR family transcriptional regulator [Gordonia sp. ABSL1-1]
MPELTDWRSTRPTTLSPILVAAKKAFHQRGFHGTSTRDIASRAGVSLPTLYYHHENKQGILVAVLQAGVESSLARVRAAVAEGHTPVEQLSNAIEAIVIHMTADLELAATAGEFRYVEADHPRRADYVAVRSEMEDLISDILRRGIDAGDFHIDQDIKETQRYLLGACQAVTIWYRPDGARTPAEVARSYAATSLRAVGAT